MAKKKATLEVAADFDYEIALGQVEAIVAELEGGELPLAQSLARFEEGQRLVKQCQQWLEHAEQRLNEVLER